MPTEDFEPPDLARLLESLYPGVPPEVAMQLLRDGGEGENVRAKPAIGPVPENVRGFLIRVDLLHTKPPVWRRFEIAGDITLDRLHDVLQTVMGWTDSHLHSFRTGTGPAAAAFATEFDRSEAGEGPFEDGVCRLRTDRRNSVTAKQPSENSSGVRP